MPDLVCASHVVLSLALQDSGRFSAGARAPNILTNLLDFTTSPIIIHLSTEEVLKNGLPQHATSWVERHPRLHFNPEQLKVAKLTPSVLAAHLSNFLHCDQPGKPCAGGGRAMGRFVLLAQNLVLFRPGLEHWVAAHSVSFCIWDVCTDLGCGNCSHYRKTLPGLQEDLRGIAWVEQGQRESPLVQRMRRQVAQAEDGVIRTRDWFLPFVRWVSQHGSDARHGSWPRRSGPINAMPHEGSFYPFWVMRRFLQAVAGTQLSDWLAASGNSHQKPTRLMTQLRPPRNASAVVNCQTFFSEMGTGELAANPKARKGTASSRSSKGACAFEELLLPTYVWQQHPELLRSSAPNVILRVWGTPLNTTRSHGVDTGRPSDLDELAAEMRAAPERYGHVFGFKVPHYQFTAVSRSLKLALAPWFASFAHPRGRAAPHGVKSPEPAWNASDRAACQERAAVRPLQRPQ